MKKGLIAILGPTASGKSDLAVNLARKFKGEIVSADSRQVYKGMDIGTGKITKKEMKGIPHHLLSIVSPIKRFTVIQYRNLAQKAIKKIFQKKKVPILCGGTGFYVAAVTEGSLFPHVPPNWRLRQELEKKSTDQLYRIVKRMDKRRAKTIDRKNPRRLIRTIEIILKIKKPVPLLEKKPLPYPVLRIGIKKEKKDLEKLIKVRLLKRLKKGMVAEVKKLHQRGVSWKRLEEFGLEYRWVSRYLQKKINLEEMLYGLEKEIVNYAKRQMTWLKRHPAPEQVRCGTSKRIHWVKNQRDAEKLVRNFLK